MSYDLLNVIFSESEILTGVVIGVVAVVEVVVVDVVVVEVVTPFIREKTRFRPSRFLQF